MMSFSVVLLVVTNLFWLFFLLYINSSWKDSYENMVEEFMDVFDRIIEKEKEEFEPKGDEMR